MLYRFIIGLILFLPLSVIHGSLSWEQNKFNQLFTHSKKPPAGFEMLVKKQTMLIDVYYLGRFITVAKASVGPDEIIFLDAKEILDKIGKLKDSEKILAQLGKPMRTNSSLVCSSQENCNQLSPDIVEVIYDPGLFRASLFINPVYLDKEQSIQWLEPSTAKLSYLNNIYMAADSGNHNFQFANFLDNINNIPLYNITSDNVIAYQNTRLNISASYANQANLGNLFDPDQAQLNVANIAHTHNQYEYSVGMIELPSTIFFASNAVLGAEIKTTLNTLSNKELFVATPITVFLPLPATVSLIKGATIIYSAKLPAGNQKIDTSAFPEGSYPVTVRINDVQGGTTIITKMVSNSILLAPRNMPQSYFSLGYLMGVRQLNSNLYDNLLPVPVYQAGTNYRLRENTGVVMKVLGSNKASFFNPGLTFLGRDFIFQPGILFSTNHRYGYTTNINWKKNQWTASYNISGISSSGNAPYDNYCFKNDPSSCALNLINQGTFYSAVSVGYGFQTGNISVFYSQNNYAGWQRLTTYGVNFITAIYQGPSGSWQLNLNASRRQVETSVFATITYNFNDATKSGNIGMGYGHFRNNYFSDAPIENVSNKSSSGSGLTTQGNIIWHKTDDTNYGYTVGLQGNTDPINKTIGATYNVSESKFQGNAYITDYSNSMGNYAQFGGVFNTRYAWAQKKSVIGSGNLDENTGIIVRVNASDPQATFDIYADDKVVLHIVANRNYLIRLQAYRTWHLSVYDTSKNLYNVQKKQKIVTLYPGNIQSLIWNATRMVSLGGRILTEQNDPVNNAVIKGAIGFAMTDDKGYFQANIHEGTKQFILYSARDKCIVKIPRLDVHKNSIYFRVLRCHSNQGSQFLKTN